jgi:hypothetical protein
MYFVLHIFFQGNVVIKSNKKLVDIKHLNYFNDKILEYGDFPFVDVDLHFTLRESLAIGSSYLWL